MRLNLLFCVCVYSRLFDCLEEREKPRETQKTKQQIGSMFQVLKLPNGFELFAVFLRGLEVFCFCWRSHVPDAEAHSSMFSFRAYVREKKHAQGHTPDYMRLEDSDQPQTCKSSD